MKVEFKYGGQSAIVSGLRDTHVAFATNQLREAAFFRGSLAQPLMFREALASLYDVVVSDYKYHPRDRLAFKAWLDQQDQKFLASLQYRQGKALEEMRALDLRKEALDRARMERLKPFYAARAAYFDWVYTHQYELNYLFDPVITVHPDEVFFEAFSRDESSYARLGARYDLFERIDEFHCGTTNIDFSAALHGQLDRMRSYRKARFDIDAGGFAVALEDGAAHKEKKIDLPESWVKGFLQVHSTMTLGLHRVRLDPVDLFNLCRFLRRHKTKVSPRAMRFELAPGQRTRVVFEPWEHAIELGPSSVYQGPKAVSIRTWGRDRLQTLARLIPVTQRVDLYLAGTGLPTIWVCDLGELTFTLALSGWTDNDWTGGKTRFDLLTRRMDCTATDLTVTLDALQKVKRGTDAALSMETNLGVEKTRSALSYLCQSGRAMFDLAGGVYRHRELFATPYTLPEAQKSVSTGSDGGGDPEAVEAETLFAQGHVLVTARRPVAGGYKLSGSVASAEGRVRPMLHVDAAARIVDATCTCKKLRNHGLTQGPCAHVLALRVAHMSRLEVDEAR